jgi:hypothetical protein
MTTAYSVRPAFPQLARLFGNRVCSRDLSAVLIWPYLMEIVSVSKRTLWRAFGSIHGRSARADEAGAAAVAAVWVA